MPDASGLIDPLPSAWRFDAIGAPWRIDTDEELTPPQRGAIAERIERYDRDWSRFRDDSLVRRIAREPGSYELPPEAGPLLALYRELYEATEGRVSPLVGRALESLGYDSSYRLRPAARRMPVPAWDAAIAWDGRRLDALIPALIDVGAAGKGQLVDLVGEVLTGLGHARWIVDASGDLRARRVPMRIALEHPGDPAKAIGVVELPVDRAIAASATTRRAWGDDLHHVLDALTGDPTRAIVATWAIARSAMIADGIATALFFDVAPNLLARHDVEYVRMFADGRIETSSDLPGEVFV
jgi:thiamine biosynthesis lipoprotein